jgi:nucleoside-diphosphate-sugar epimerase
MRPKQRILITGSSGFVGSILFRNLLDLKYNVIGIDLMYSETIPKKKQILCNLCDLKKLNKKLKKYKFDIIIHLAAKIDFSTLSQELLFKNNIESTKNIAKYANLNKIKRIIFTSSNSVFLGLNKKIISDSDPMKPTDMYGKSKEASENILNQYNKKFYINILRCPIIIDAGRIGMLTILFEIIKFNAVVWVLNKGKIKHQFLYAKDLVNIIIKLFDINKSLVLNVGSNKSSSFFDIFKNLIKDANSKSKIISLPSFVIIPIIKILYFLKMSPLGPYQWRMLTKNFEFNLDKLKKELNFRSTISNNKILKLAYNYYLNNTNITNKVSANKTKIRIGFLSILKYIKFL